MKSLLESMLRQGPAGLVAGFILILAMLIFPQVRPWYQEYREQDREDLRETEINCQSLLAEVRSERNSFLSESTRLREEMAELRAEMRMDRRVDYESKVARWRLDKQLRLTWFNPEFTRTVLLPQGLNPYNCYDKTWAEMLEPSVAAHAAKTDREIMLKRVAMSYDDGFTLEKRDGISYRVYWRVIKEPLLDEHDDFQGIRGTALPYREEKIR